MLPDYQASETFRDDMMDIPWRWGVPEGLDLVNLRDLARETCLSPAAIRRWEDEGLPTIRYQPWVLYDRARVREWLAAHRPEPTQTITSEQARKPLLVVMEALAAGLVTAEDASGLFERLGAAVLLGSYDLVWSAQWDAQHDRERQGNAARYGLSDPTGNWLGIPPDEEASNVYEIRDLTRRLSVSPIDIVRWTHQGMPSLRWSPYVRWDVRHVTQWLTEQAILPTQYAMHELDLTALFVCRAVAVGDATADEGHEALSGWYGVT
jgi:hypothetical protein